VGPFSTMGCVRSPWGTSGSMVVQCSVAATLVTLLCFNLSWFFFLRTDGRSERGMAPLQVKWRGGAPWPHKTARHGTMLHSHRT
jgi:hypothetical protein